MFFHLEYYGRYVNVILRLQFWGTNPPYQPYQNYANDICNSPLSLAQIAATQVSPDLIQLYGKGAHTLEFIGEVEPLGYSVIFLIIDAVVPGSRERGLSGFRQIRNEKLK